MTTTLNAATDVFNRPAARFNGDRLDVRASALGRCRRALWYAATGQPITNPTTPESQIVLEAGNALEPVVVRAMQRAGLASHAGRPRRSRIGRGRGRLADRDWPPRRHRPAAR